MKKMLALAIALMMALCLPFGALADGFEEEEIVTCMTMSIPVPAGWQSEVQEESNMLSMTFMPDPDTKQAINMMGMDLEDASVAGMAMYVYKMMFADPAGLKEAVISMIGIAGEDAEQAAEILEKMEASASEPVIDGREAVEVDFSLENEGEKYGGMMVFTTDGQYMYVIMCMAEASEDGILEYYRSVIDRISFAPAGEAAA